MRTKKHNVFIRGMVLVITLAIIFLAGINVVTAVFEKPMSNQELMAKYIEAEYGDNYYGEFIKVEIEEDGDEYLNYRVLDAEGNHKYYSTTLKTYMESIVRKGY